jgi:hypothetical protein
VVTAAQAERCEEQWIARKTDRLRDERLVDLRTGELTAFDQTARQRQVLLLVVESRLPVRLQDRAVREGQREREGRGEDDAALAAR